MIVLFYFCLSMSFRKSMEKISIISFIVPNCHSCVIFETNIVINCCKIITQLNTIMTSCLSWLSDLVHNALRKNDTLS